MGGLSRGEDVASAVGDGGRETETSLNRVARVRGVEAMGGGNMLASRRRGPVTAHLLARACEVYLERFALPGGRVPATFEILTLTAWAPDESQPKAHHDDADVLDGRIGQQPLHIGLDGGEHHTEQRRKQSNEQSHHSTPTGLDVQQAESDTQQASAGGLPQPPPHTTRHPGPHCR